MLYMYLNICEFFQIQLNAESWRRPAVLKIEFASVNKEAAIFSSFFYQIARLFCRCLIGLLPDIKAAIVTHDGPSNTL